MKAGARLTAGLLAPKGTALPLKKAYASPYLNPVLPGRGAGESGPMRQLAAAERARVACRLEPDEYRRLRILAARRRIPAGALLREALRAFLTVNAADCPCLRGERAEPGSRKFGCCEDHEYRRGFASALYYRRPSRARRRTAGNRLFSVCQPRPIVGCQLTMGAGPAGRMIAI